MPAGAPPAILPAMSRRIAPAALAALALAACAAPPGPDAPAPERGALPERVTLFRPEGALEDGWRIFRVWREADVALAPLGERVAIRAAAEGASAGVGLYREIDVGNCPVVEWTWRVDALPETAALASREAEDMAASILFIFGDPVSLTMPRPVPTLRYVWATEEDPEGTVADSPYVPGVIRSLVVRSGPDRLGETVTERRDLAADFERAFGRPPEGPVEVIALYTDSDHGESPVEAFYLGADALCAEPVIEDLIL